MLDRRFLCGARWIAFAVAMSVFVFPAATWADEEIPERTIAEVQGSGLASPLLGDTVKVVTTVVTAVLDNGFFIQTPNNESDEDPETSEGLFVFTDTPPAVSLRDSVEVTGEVAETNNLTQLIATEVLVTSSGNGLPTPTQLTASDPSPENADPYLELEKFEGMRVTLSEALVISPVDENGRLIAQANNMSRPFREEGILFPGLPELPVWNGNPAAFSVQMDALGLNVTQLNAYSTFNALGILTQEGDEYVLYPTSITVTEPVGLDGPIRERGFREFSFVSLNLEDFRVLSGSPEAEEAYLDRKAKILQLVREGLRDPDMIAFQGVEAAALKALRDDILADGGPKYVKFISESAEPDGLENAFLWREDTMVLTAVETVDQFTRDSTDTEYLFQNVPMIFRGAYLGGPEAFPFRVINVDLLPMDGIDAAGAAGERVQRLRREQAVYLANLLQDYQQAANPVPTMLAGAINAFEFSDGYVDVNGILTGDVDPDNALLDGPAIVDPFYINQAYRIPQAERYSAILADGSAAALDHSIADEVMDNLITDVQYLHVNADAAAGLALDNENFYRTSSRDPLVVFVATTTDVVVDSLEDTNDFDLSPGNLELREALAVVVDGGQIRFAPSLFTEPRTIALDPDLGTLLVRKNLRIIGPGQDLLTISGSNGIRVMTIDNLSLSNSNDVLITDLTIADGETLSFEGGGIFNNENLTLRRVRIRDCESLQGGGLFSYGNVTLDNCLIDNNVAGIVGGGIAATFFTGLQIIDSTIRDNTAEFSDGGGIFIDTLFFVTVTVRNSTLSGNRAGGDGGGLWNNSAVAMVNSTLSGNMAFGQGGALFDQSIGGVQIYQSTITANTANANLSGVGKGGGIFSRFDGPTLRNTLVAGNTEEVTNGAAAHHDLSGDFTLDGNNVIGESAGASTPGPTDFVLSDLGFSTVNDVINPTLANNGGPTATHSLVPGSIAINSGNPDFAVDPISLVALNNDQRGPGFPRVRSTAVDIGAYEQEIDSEAPTLTIEQAPDQADPTNAFPIRFDAIFSKGVIDFDASDVVTGGTATGLSIEVVGGGAQYAILITGAETDGTITVSLPAGVVSDPFGNTNTASQSEDNEVTLDRTVPVITLLGRATESVECGAPYIEPGFEAIDPFQGDLSDAVIVTGFLETGLSGTYTLNYNVTDNAGNAAITATRTIVVADTTAPVLTLVGPASVDVLCGSPFNDPGATAFDACEGNLSEFIEIDDSDLDTDTFGTYEIRYTVADSKGKTGLAIRTVNVLPSQACITNHSGDWDGNNRFSLSEILRLVQFFNTGEFHCDPSTEDGYRPGPGIRDCSPHSSDYNPQDWTISLSELLRAIQFFNAGGYIPCPEANTEDGFCLPETD